MVVDAKAMTWAAQNGIDTAKLKAAKVPIYGKWYFPTIPANVPLVNLEDGIHTTFSEPMVAGELLWVAEADVNRLLGLSAEPNTPAALGAPSSEAPENPAQRGLAAPEPEPIFMMSRDPRRLSLEAADDEANRSALELFREPVPALPDLPQAWRGPLATIGPFVLAIGLSLFLAGLVLSLAIAVVGLLWVIAGAAAWFRIGIMEAMERPADDPSFASDAAT